jgi:hypothetical protein
VDELDDVAQSMLLEEAQNRVSVVFPCREQGQIFGELVGGPKLHPSDYPPEMFPFYAPSLQSMDSSWNVFVAYPSPVPSST